MKNTFKVLGVISMALIIGFAMTACVDDDDSGGGTTHTGGKTLNRITAEYLSVEVIFPDTTLHTLKDGLTVKAHYSDNTEKTLAMEDYELSGTLTTGESVITVTYEGKTTTFKVTVHAPHTHIWSGWTTTATCTEPGEETRNCTANPPHHETRNADALGHDYVWTVTTPPTIAAEGEETGICSRDPLHTETRAITAATFTSVANMKTWLDAQPNNTAATAYAVKLNVSTLLSNPSFKNVLTTNSTKYVSIDLSGSTFTDIGGGVLQDCTSLVGVTIGSGVTVVGDWAFYGTGLTSVTFKGANTTFNDNQGAFPGNLMPVYTANGIGKYKLAGTTWLFVKDASSINPLDITSAADLDAWLDAQPANTDATNPYAVKLNMSDLTGIADVLKSNSTKYVSIELGSTLTSIGQMAFNRCTSLTSITIPASVTGIVPFVFDGCTNLTSVTFATGSSITAANFEVNTTIGDLREKYLAYGAGVYTTTAPVSNSSVWTIQIAPIVFTTINDFATWLVAQNDNIAAAPYVVKLNVSDLTGIDTVLKNNNTKYVSIELGSTLTSIGDWAFDGCSRLTSLTIPASVTSIGQGAFSGCYGLTGIEVNPANSAYSSSDGVLYNKDKTTLIRYPIKKAGTTFTIPASVTSIGNRAFEGCDSFTRITIPAGVTSIGQNAFNNCTNLTRVTFATGSNITAANFSFAFTGDLRDKYLATGAGSYTRPANGSTWTTAIDPSTVDPNNITSIGALDAWLDAQPANTAAEPYTVTLNVSDLGGSYSTAGSAGYVLRQNSKYVNLVLGGTLTSIANQAFRQCTSLASVTIGNGITTSIGNGAFSQCTSLASVTIGNGVTSIGDSAFSSCTSLASVTIGNGVTSIGSSAFEGCTSLTSVTFTATSKVASIANYAFQNCTSLASITIPDSVTSIGTEAFRGCSSLASVTFEATSKVTSIGNQAFQDCTSLTSITIPASVTSIGTSVFHGCTSLTSVTFATGSNIATASFGNYAFPQGSTGDGGNNLKTAYTNASTGGAGTYTRADTTATAWAKN